MVSSQLGYITSRLLPLLGLLGTKLLLECSADFWWSKFSYSPTPNSPATLAFSATLSVRYSKASTETQPNPIRLQLKPSVLTRSHINFALSIPFGGNTQLCAM